MHDDRTYWAHLPYNSSEIHDLQQQQLLLQ